MFRTNSSYKRWDEARKFWGLNINHTRDLNRMATAWYGNESELDSTESFLGKGTSSTSKAIIDPNERQYLLGQVSLMTWAFVRSMKRHLSPPREDEEAYVQELKAKLSPSQADAIISAARIAPTVLCMIYQLLLKNFPCTLLERMLSTTIFQSLRTHWVAVNVSYPHLCLSSTPVILQDS